MTRPFFCGLAALLTFDASGMLYLGHDALTKTVSNWVGIVSLLVAGCSIWAAQRMPQSKTWWTAILLWISGGVVAVIALWPVFYFFGEMPHR
jgi:Flp pilus assembly protein protease CpaA